MYQDITSFIKDSQYFYANFYRGKGIRTNKHLGSALNNWHIHLDPQINLLLCKIAADSTRF